jgi:hypothetical protein
MKNKLKTDCETYLFKERDRDIICKKLDLLQDKNGHDNLKETLAK